MPHVPRRAVLHFSADLGKVSVGLKTRTAIAVSPLARCLPLARKDGETCEALGGVSSPTAYVGVVA